MADSQLYNLTTESTPDATMMIPLQKADGSTDLKKTPISEILELGPNLSSAADNFLLGKEAGVGAGDVEGLSPVRANALINKSSTLTFASTITPNFNDTQIVRKIAVTGALTFATATNKGDGKEKVFRLQADSSGPYTLTFPSDWIFIGPKPTNIAASKRAFLTLYCEGTAESEISASYAVQS